MKANKIKPQKKSAKKVAKKHLEQSFSAKFIEVVVGLGHNAEDIAGEIATLSKIAAKKFSKKLKEVKLAVEHKIEEVGSAKVSKPNKKGSPSMAKAGDKAAKPKPIASSVKVPRIAGGEKTVSNAKSQSKVMEKKVSASADNAKKAVVKAVTNNPVKKVAKKAIPTKTNTTGKK
ncbi:MAG: hypothetical protein REI78_01425 [Pedobacter sp.]|nr:hypothetical protein [Pedobacter sp.]